MEAAGAIQADLEMGTGLMGDIFSRRRGGAATHQFADYF